MISIAVSLIADHARDKHGHGLQSVLLQDNSILLKVSSNDCRRKPFSPALIRCPTKPFASMPI
jgi:hypothetical protein